MIKLKFIFRKLFYLFFAIKILLLIIILTASILFFQAYISKFVEFPEFSKGNIEFVYNCKKDKNIRNEEITILESNIKEIPKLRGTDFYKVFHNGIEIIKVQNEKRLEYIKYQQEICQNHTFLIYFFISLIPLFGLSFWVWKDWQFLTKKTIN